ncbi:NAD-dependent deacetylase [Propionicimonas paludicola]|uniref:NAD-dependent protein deacetylase n=1 Tax=Propionicimonas paludicola TaxID=185243 RepID=A0A2A9CPJ8_9ACTN|nr:NAD-dependent protein deacylase [Propionicimonas paludicola]PFG16323.1 NAD-dependent deacetylase [Propionicimonas paludicola]
MSEQLAEVIASARRIVFFGGAGVSTESGIPDFRSGKGLYQRWLGPYFSPEDILSHHFFTNHTAEFFDYYRKNLLHPQAKPNPAHLALAKLEAQGKLSAVITQNIDGLHQAAGSQRVLELHGSVLRNRCVRCGTSYPMERILEAEGIPRCECGATVKPDVVLYGESLNQQVLDEAVAELAAADTLIVGGTSLVVQPAAGLTRAFTGEHLVLINSSRTALDSHAELVIREPIGQALGSAVS